MPITNKNKVDAVMMALTSNKNLTDSLMEIVGEKIGENDVPKITKNDVMLMIQNSKILESIVDVAVKNADKETGDEKKTNKKVITGAKRLVNKMKPMTSSPQKMEGQIDDLKKLLGV